MPTGTIARLLIDKRFGFIRDEGGIEHFFHRSSVRGAVFELLRDLGRLAPQPLMVIIERDGRFPPIAGLLDQLDVARAALAAGRELQP